MDITDLISRLSLHSRQDLHSRQNPRIKQIIQQINHVAQLGYNSLVYDFDSSDDILDVCNNIKQEFPEISIQIVETSIIFDWS